MSPGPRPDRLPVETGSGPPREQWQSLRAFVAGGDGGRVRPRSRSAHGHVPQGTRPARNLPPTRGRKLFRPAVEAPAEGLRPGRRLRSAPFRLAPSSSTGGRVAEVEAHITGTVWKIECEVGDEIDEGDTVVILESMKMEMPVEAEDAGTVKEILCEEGQAVNEGDTLVRLETPRPRAGRPAHRRAGGRHPPADHLQPRQAQRARPRDPRRDRYRGERS